MNSLLQRETRRYYRLLVEKRTIQPWDLEEGYKLSSHYNNIKCLNVYRSNWNNRRNQQVLEKVLSAVKTANKGFDNGHIKGT